MSVKKVNDSNFIAEVINSDRPVLVDFSTENRYNKTKLFVQISLQWQKF